MKNIINWGIYAVDLRGTNSYEFKGTHPAIVVRTLKEENMYIVVPLTTYTKKKWEKFKRKRFVARLISTNSIARIDKFNVVSIEQIGDRYYNLDKIMIPNIQEIENIMKKLEKYIFLSNTKAAGEYKKCLEQREKVEFKINKLIDTYNIESQNQIKIELDSSECSYLTNTDLKDIIKKRIKNSSIKISKTDAGIRIDITFNKKNIDFKGQVC